MINFVKKYKAILDVAAVGGAVAGSTLIAANIGFNNLGYLFFLISSVAAYILVKHSNASRSLLFMNGYFIIINILGLIRY